MYLYIFEDGEVKKGTKFSDDDKECCEDGLMDVIDLHAENPKWWTREGWADIESAD